MKKWVLFIFRINSRLDALCEQADMYIENTALSLRGNVSEAYADILRQTEKKIRLINLRVIYRNFCERLSAGEMKALYTYAFDEPENSFKVWRGISKSTALRRVAVSFARCEKAMKILGFDEGRMEEEYGIMAKQLERIEAKRRKDEEKEGGSIYLDKILASEIVEKKVDKRESGKTTGKRERVRKERGCRAATLALRNDIPLFAE